jgi:ataxin-3
MHPCAHRAAAAADEEADLAAAIAASMQDYSAGAAGPSNANPSSSAGGAGSSYAAVARQAADAAAGDVGLAQQFGVADTGAVGGDFGFEDEDPELAAALAASLEEHQQSQQQSQQDQQHQQQHERQAAVEVPEEPAEGVDGAVTVAFRLPSGGRLSRRFSSRDSVAVLQAWVAQQLLQGGTTTHRMRQGQKVVLSTQFPKKQLQPEQELSAAGVEDRSMLSVQIS